MPFASLGLSPSLSNPLARLGYTTPTPVQLKSIPIVLTGKDLLARAFCHEMDHLNGVLFTKHVVEQIGIQDQLIREEPVMN